MGGYSKFNIVFYINGVEFVDCRAYLKLGTWLYRRIGADEYNNVEYNLTPESVEGWVLYEQLDYNLLMTEAEMLQDLTGGLL